MKTAIQFCMLLLTLLVACSKGGDVTPPQEVSTKFPSPTWQIDQPGRYPATMTAVISLPPKLAANILETDKLAAFVNDECRGEGQIVAIDSAKLFFVLIRGATDEQAPVKFKYYSAKTSYMYQSQGTLNFLVDDGYGTASEPKVLDLVQMK